MEPSQREDAKDALQSNVRRMQDAILQAQRRQAAYMQTWMDHGGWAMSRRERRRMERRFSRQIDREEWRRRRRPTLGPVIVFFVLGFWFLSTAAHHSAANPVRWLGLGFIVSAVALLIKARNRRREAEPSTEAQPVQSAERPPTDSKQASSQQTRPEPDRTETLCEKLIQEIRAGPQALREVVHKPEETIASLRKACAALRERERSLRAMVTKEDSRRLDAERDELTNRIRSETDEVVRDRLSSALKSLEEQVKQRSNIVTSAARLEAERTRIHYALENLYTQVLSVKSADAASADVAGTGLRQSLNRLSDEVSAVAESLEAVSRGEDSVLPPVSRVSSEQSDSNLRADRETS
jgi:hypothetical protein